MPLPLKLFEISDVVLKDKTRGECLKRMMDKQLFFYSSCESTSSTFILNLVKLYGLALITVLPPPSLHVSTNQMWVRGTVGGCAPFTTTRTRALR